MKRLPSCAALAVVGAWILQTGCGVIAPGGGVLEELERNDEIWASLEPSMYAYGVERLCFCGVEARGPVRVAVSGGQVVDRTYIESNAPVPSSFEDLFPSVEGLFDILRDAIARDAHVIEVTYDVETGVPIDFWIDYAENIADEELGFRVTESVASLPQH